MATNSNKNKHKNTAEQLNTKFPIVGIGASAGGLKAFSTFFSLMPENCGMAFVLVAHLDPVHASMLPELIQRKTKMQVSQLSNNLRVKADHVYVIPPDKEITIVNGKLQLMEMQKSHGLNLPINIFLHSLAQDQTDYAIAIILSGTGSDGTQGIQSIKVENGMVMAQEESSAKYGDMPRNAIATGLVDFVLPVEKMPEQLLQYVTNNNQSFPGEIKTIDKKTLKSLQKIFILLHNNTNHDFSSYKKNTICRRIERRMQLHQITDINNYVHFLQNNKQEIATLFKELLIGVTSFFRDPEAFELLKNKYLPELLKNKANDYHIRIWIPGCSSGEEVYSIAIIVQECLIDLNRHFSIQIFGTDIDENAITLARTGLYPQSIETDVSPERLEKFFIPHQGHYQIKKVIREMVVFASQNVINDPPFRKLDLICCRNLLIYFNSELQKKLLPIFHYSLKKQGLLFLGSSESIGQTNDLFDYTDKKWKIFKRSGTETPSQTDLIFTGSSSIAQHSEKTEMKSAKNIEQINNLNLLKTIITQSEISTRVIIDSKSDIIYIHGKTGQFLEHTEGTINTNIIEMARPGLKAGLIQGINQIKNNKEVVINNLQISNSGTNINFNLKIRSLPESQIGYRDLLMVIFEKISSANQNSQQKTSPANEHEKDEELSKLEDELQYTKENLQSTIEELETANEEMRSANEELQSSNEELQSTNEELETSKEELQSLNEESVTVNTELQSRIDELVNARDDIKNLLDATDIASIFLDINLGIRRFTPKATEIFPFTSADIGRPFYHFSSKLKHIDLYQFANNVLQNLSMQEVEVEVEEGKFFRMRIRPYRTTNNIIDGVVITFEDITKIKQIESELIHFSNMSEKNSLIMSGIFMDCIDAIVIEDMNGIIINANHEAIKNYGWTRDELIGKEIKTISTAEHQIQIKEILKNYSNNQKTFPDYKGTRIHKSGKKIPVVLNYILINDSKNQLCAIASRARNYQFPSRDTVK